MVPNNTSTSQDNAIAKAQEFGSTLEDLLDIIENLDESLSEANARIKELEEALKEL